MARLGSKISRRLRTSETAGLRDRVFRNASSATSAAASRFRRDSWSLREPCGFAAVLRRRWARHPQLHRANNSKMWCTLYEEERRPSPYERTLVVPSLGSNAGLSNDTRDPAAG